LGRSRSARDVDAYQRSQHASADSGDAWTDIQAALDRGDNQKALSLAKRFVARQPGYHYSHATLGSVYVAMNDFTNAESAYVRAVDLYPVEEHEKALAAIRKRLARERGAQAQAR
jgi:cytochrome c-type biogenesis protein CcmH/NrfG